MAGFKYEVIKDFGVISNKGDWETRLRLVSYNDKPVKYDIRPWHKEEKDKTGKGITLHKDEVDTLRNILNEMIYLDDENGFTPKSL